MNTVTQLLRRRFVVGLIVGLLVVLPLWWFAWMAPAGGRLASAQGAQRADEATRVTLLERLTELREDKGDAKVAKRYLAMFSQAVPSSPDAADLVVQVYDLAKRDGVKLSGITDNSEVANDGYSTIPVSMSIVGGHDALLAFVGGLYGIPRLVTIQSLSLSGAGDLNQSNESSMTATIAATAYTLASSSSSGATS